MKTAVAACPLLAAPGSGHFADCGLLRALNWSKFCIINSVCRLFDTLAFGRGIGPEEGDEPQGLVRRLSRCFAVRLVGQHRDDHTAECALVPADQLRLNTTALKIATQRREKNYDCKK